MKKRKSIFIIMVLAFCLGTMSATVSAYIRRGTVEISVDQEKVELKQGESCQVAVTLNPEQEDQMPGCGMADCPEECGENCLSADGNCTCDITSYKTYYTNVEIEIEDPKIVDVVYQDGIAVFTALEPGETKVNLAARLREYTGSSVDITVTVETSGVPTGVFAGIAGAVVIAVVLLILFIRRKKLTSVGIFFILVVLGMSGCSSKTVQNNQQADTVQKTETVQREADAACLEEVEIATSNQGSLETQMLSVSMKFDKDVTGMEANDFQVILNEQEMESSAIRLETDENTAHLFVSIDLLKNGQLEVICSSYIAGSFTVQAVVSPGLELTVAEQNVQEATVVMEVSHVFDVRGIAQISLLENGEAVPTQDTGNTVSYVHGHDFLEIDAEMAAQSVAETMSERYSEGYLFTAQGNQITVEKTDATEPVELELAVVRSVNFHVE